MTVEQPHPDRRSVILKEQWMLNRILAMLAVVAVLTLAVSCGGAARTNPSATPAAGSPTLEAQASSTPAVASPPPTGIAAVDDVIRATLAGDKGALVAMLGYTKLGCVRPQQEGTPPGCVDGEADGTPVDSFLTMGCGGGYERPDVAERVVRNSPTPARLFAAGRPAVSGAFDGSQYLLLFAHDQSAASPGFWWNVRDGKIVGYVQTCLTVVDALRFLGEPIIPAPFGPHASGAREIAGERLTDFIPPPYYGFLVTGSFDRTIDEVGATDPFAWSVPASLVYDGVARWWRVYWHRGQVFDCAVSCTAALPEADADARLKSLHAGDPICIRGWTDDVGNIEAEAVYMHPPTDCRVQN